MFPIALYQLSGLAGALYVQLLLLAVARRLAGAFWPFAYLTSVVALAFVLAWRALVPMPWLVPTAFVALSLAGALSTWQLATGPSGPAWRAELLDALACWRLPPGLPRWVRPANVLAAAFLCIDLVWAAFPAYRYDQWNYHLLIPKILAHLGTLPRPVFYDHVYFTGVYEYLFAIPRWLWDQDTFSLCFADATTWLVYTVSLLGLLRYASKRFDWPQPLAFLLLAALFYATPEHESLTNAKPDLLLTPMALACVVLLEEQMRAGSRRLCLWLGFMLLLPVAIKVIWLQFLAAFGLALGLFWLTRKLRVDVFAVILGALAALVLALPALVKNYVFFHNPLHPAQMAIFHSVPWVQESDDHWRVDTGRATSLPHYFNILGAVPWHLAKLVAWFLPPLLVGGVLTLRRRLPATPALTPLRSAKLLGLALAIFMLIWPVFFDPRHQARYIDSLFGALMLVVCYVAARLGATRLIAVALLVSVLGNSSVDVRVRKVAQGTFKAHDAFYDTGKAPMDLYIDSQLINRHRAQTFHDSPDAMQAHITLSDTPSLYFLDSLNQRVNQADWVIVYDEYLAAGGKPCLWAFLQQLDVSYILSYEHPFADWPQQLAPLFTSEGASAGGQRAVRGGEALDAGHAIYYLPSAFVALQVATAPECRGG